MLPNTTPYLLLISVLLGAATTATAVPLKPTDPRSRIHAREFLDAHNNVRRRYGAPPLVWDKELSRYAHHHGNQLVKTCTIHHSIGPYGENIFWAERPELWTPTKIVNSWAGESAWFDRRTLGCSKGPTACGHYTQLVWFDTKRVGCRMLPCLNKPGVIAVCSYDPPGNFFREDPLVSHKPVLPVLPLPLPLPLPFLPKPKPR